MGGSGPSSHRVDLGAFIGLIRSEHRGAGAHRGSGRFGVAGCGGVGAVRILDGSVVVDPGHPVVLVSLNLSMAAEGSTGTVDWCFEPVRLASSTPCPPHGGRLSVAD
jgi:hypothetical protein